MSFTIYIQRNAKNKTGCYAEKNFCILILKNAVKKFIESNFYGSSINNFTFVRELCLRFCDNTAKVLAMNSLTIGRGVRSRAKNCPKMSEFIYGRPLLTESSEITIHLPQSNRLNNVTEVTEVS